MPQLEDGYTKIANELLEALIRYRIPGEQMQVFLFILRKTYGFNKITDFITNSQFVEATGIRKQNTKRAIQGLIDKNMVIKKEYPRMPSYRINKKYTTWQPYSKRSTVIKKESNSTPKGVPQKKERKTTKTFSSDSIEYRLSNYLLNFILKRNPDHKKPNFQTWGKHIDYLLRLDKRKVDDVKKVIKWSQNDTFWQAVILSTSNLRDKYDQLVIKMGGFKAIDTGHSEAAKTKKKLEEQLRG